jgi:hypothetical protein
MKSINISIRQQFNGPVNKKQVKDKEREIWEKLKKDYRPCPICNNHSTINGIKMPVDPFHVLLECGHMDMRRARSRWMANLPSSLTRIFCESMRDSKVHTHYDDNSIVITRNSRGVCFLDNTSKCFSSVDWSSKDGAYCLYRLLLMTTWDTNGIIDTPDNVDKTMAQIFANLFEQLIVPPFLIRNMINEWAKWATDINNIMCGIWTERSKEYYTNEVDIIINSTNLTGNIINK